MLQEAALATKGISRSGTRIVLPPISYLLFYPASALLRDAVAAVVPDSDSVAWAQSPQVGCPGAKPFFSSVKWEHMSLVTNWRSRTEGDTLVIQPCAWKDSALHIDFLFQWLLVHPAFHWPNEYHVPDVTTPVNWQVTLDLYSEPAIFFSAKHLMPPSRI